MNQDYRVRIVHDYKEIKNLEGSEEEMYIQVDPQDITKWKCFIFGPKASPFENGVFVLAISFSEDYPNEPPEVEFLGKVFHPNVYESGKICLDLLQNKWSSSYTTRSLLLAISTLLDDPNVDSPANQDAAVLFAKNYEEYQRRVKFCVIESWVNPEVKKYYSNEFKCYK